MPRTSRRLRDMARRREEMMRRRDYARGGRDMRNPYGSAGGYVTSRRGGRDRLMMEDMRMYRENPEMYNLADMTRQNREIEHDPYTPYMYKEYDGHYMDYPYMDDYVSDYARRERRDYARGRRTGRYSRADYAGYDYADGEEEYLDDETLMEWSKEMLDKVEEKDKPYFTKENIEKKAKEMGIKYDDFTFPELYTATLMKFTDHSKTLGTANKDTYILMAKDFFEDEDSELQGSEKLAAYYYNVVCAEE